jgi:hypothetical protein
MNEDDLDPRWEWVEITSCEGKTWYVKGRCKHLEIVPVEAAIGGEILAWLCVTCDTRLAYA